MAEVPVFRTIREQIADRIRADVLSGRLIVPAIATFVMMSGISASSRARKTLYAGLACMVLGVGILTVSQYLKKVSDDRARTAEAAASAVQDTIGALGSI